MTHELEGALAPPMTNGELAFEEPWQGRVFGMASSLCDAGHYEWREFQAELIRVIGAYDAAVEEEGASDGDEYRYYDHFLAALEALLQSKGLMDGQLLETRTAEFEARPHGHDH